MKNKTWLLALALLPLTATAAETSALGRWTTLDDETGKPMSVTEVKEENGKLVARVVETLNTPNATCTECSGAQKGKPIIGMRVLWDLQKTGDGWGNGQGFKPSTGDSFKAKSVKVTNGGKTLEITGCKMMFCRTAKWQRAA